MKNVSARKDTKTYTRYFESEKWNIISFTLHIVLILRYLPLRIKAFTSKCVWGYKVSNSLQGRWPTFGNTLSWIRCISDTHDICIASMTGPSYVNVDICLEITRDLHDTLILNFTFICIFKEFFFFCNSLIIEQSKCK